MSTKPPNITDEWEEDDLTYSRRENPNGFVVDASDTTGVLVKYQKKLLDLSQSNNHFYFGPFKWKYPGLTIYNRYHAYYGTVQDGADFDANNLLDGMDISQIANQKFLLPDLTYGKKYWRTDRWHKNQLYFWNATGSTYTYPHGGGTFNGGGPPDHSNPVQLLSYVGDNSLVDLQNSSRHYPNSTSIITRYSDAKPFDFTLTTAADKRVQQSLKGVLDLWVAAQGTNNPHISLNGFDTVHNASVNDMNRQFYRAADNNHNITQEGNYTDIKRYNASALTTEVNSSYKIYHPIIYTGETIRFHLYDPRIQTNSSTKNLKTPGSNQPAKIFALSKSRLLRAGTSGNFTYSQQDDYSDSNLLTSTEGVTYYVNGTEYTTISAFKTAFDAAANTATAELRFDPSKAYSLLTASDSSLGEISGAKYIYLYFVNDVAASFNSDASTSPIARIEVRDTGNGDREKQYSKGIVVNQQQARLAHPLSSNIGTIYVAVEWFRSHMLNAARYTLWNRELCIFNFVSYNDYANTISYQPIKQWLYSAVPLEKADGDATLGLTDTQYLNQGYWSQPALASSDHPDRRAWHHSESNKSGNQESKLVHSNGNINGSSYKLKDFIIGAWAHAVGVLRASSTGGKEWGSYSDGTNASGSWTSNTNLAWTISYHAGYIGNYGQGDMKQWHSKTAAERAAAEPATGNWSGDTTDLFANLAQHWIDTGTAHGKEYYRRWNRYQSGQVWHITTNNSFVSNVQDYLGIVQRSKNLTINQLHASFKYIKENITGDKLQYEGTYNGSPYKWSLGGEEVNGGFANFEFHANPTNHLDLSNVFRKWTTNCYTFRYESMGTYTPSTWAGKKQVQFILYRERRNDRVRYILENRNPKTHLYDPNWTGLSVQTNASTFDTSDPGKATNYFVNGDEFTLMGDDITETYDLMDPYEVTDSYSWKPEKDYKVRVLRNGSWVSGTIIKEYTYHTYANSIPNSWQTAANNYVASYVAAAEAGNPIPQFDPSTASGLIGTTVTGANPDQGEGYKQSFNGNSFGSHPYYMRILESAQRKARRFDIEIEEFGSTVTLSKVTSNNIRIHNRPQQKYKLTTKDRINDGHIQSNIDVDWIVGPDGRNSWGLFTSSGDSTFEKGHKANTLDSRSTDYNEPHFRNVIKYSGTMAHIHRIQTKSNSGDIIQVTPKVSGFGNTADSGYEYGTSLPKTVTGSQTTWKRPNSWNNPALLLQTTENDRRVRVINLDLNIPNTGKAWVNGTHISGSTWLDQDGIDSVNGGKLVVGFTGSFWQKANFVNLLNFYRQDSGNGSNTYTTPNALRLKQNTTEYYKYQGGCLNEAIIYDSEHTETQIKDYMKALNKKWKVYKTDTDNYTFKSGQSGGSYISSSTALALPTGLGNKIVHYNSDPSNVSGAASITLSDGTTLTRITSDTDDTVSGDGTFTTAHLYYKVDAPNNAVFNFTILPNNAFQPTPIITGDTNNLVFNPTNAPSWSNRYGLFTILLKAESLDATKNITYKIYVKRKDAKDTAKDSLNSSFGSDGAAAITELNKIDSSGITGDTLSGSQSTIILGEINRGTGATIAQKRKRRRAIFKYLFANLSKPKLTLSKDSLGLPPTVKMSSTITKMSVFTPSSTTKPDLSSLSSDEGAYIPLETNDTVTVTINSNDISFTCVGENNYTVTFPSLSYITDKNVIQRRNNATINITATSVTNVQEDDLFVIDNKSITISSVTYGGNAGTIRIDDFNEFSDITAHTGQVVRVNNVFYQLTDNPTNINNFFIDHTFLDNTNTTTYNADSNISYSVTTAFESYVASSLTAAHSIHSTGASSFTNKSNLSNVSKTVNDNFKGAIASTLKNTQTITIQGNCSETYQNLHKNSKINTTVDLLKTYNKYNDKLDTLINNNLDIHNYTNKNTDIVSDSTKYIDSIQTIHHKKDANIFVTDGFSPHTVTVTASGGEYYINNQPAPALKFTVGRTYIFELSDNSLDSPHPLLISTSENGPTAITNGVVYKLDGNIVTETNYKSGFAAATTRQLLLTPPNNTTLWYYCNNHNNMGERINFPGNQNSTSTNVCHSDYNIQLSHNVNTFVHNHLAETVLLNYNISGTKYYNVDVHGTSSKFYNNASLNYKTPITIHTSNNETLSYKDTYRLDVHKENDLISNTKTSNSNTTVSKNYESTYNIDSFSTRDTRTHTETSTFDTHSDINYKSDFSNSVYGTFTQNLNTDYLNTNKANFTQVSKNQLTTLNQTNILAISGDSTETYSNKSTNIIPNNKMIIDGSSEIKTTSNMTLTSAGGINISTNSDKSLDFDSNVCISESSIVSNIPYIINTTGLSSYISNSGDENNMLTIDPIYSLVLITLDTNNTIAQNYMTQDFYCRLKLSPGKYNGQHIKIALHPIFQSFFNNVNDTDYNSIDKRISNNLSTDIIIRIESFTDVDSNEFVTADLILNKGGMCLNLVYIQTAANSDSISTTNIDHYRTSGSSTTGTGYWMLMGNSFSS